SLREPAAPCRPAGAAPRRAAHLAGDAEGRDRTRRAQPRVPRDRPARAGAAPDRDEPVRPQPAGGGGGPMKTSLLAGIEHELRFVVPLAKTVPALYPESPEFRQMPEVFATGFLVGLLEWACIRCVNPHLDWPAEQTVGVHIDASHCAATP